MDPFPGNIGQVFQAKNLDEKPKFPAQFPVVLKELVYNGWSKKPRERPEIKKFRFALSVMLEQEENKNLTQLTDESKIASFPDVFKGEYHLDNHLLKPYSKSSINDKLSYVNSYFS
jgi:hypothetical protein